MIIDFHTHIFPEKIAAAAISSLAMRSGLVPTADGTAEGLKSSMRDAGIDISVVLPVVTTPRQFDSINRFAESINNSNGLISFGGIHPDCENIEEKLEQIKAAGLKGIKIHPDYQGTFIDDDRYVRIISHAIKLGLFVVTHSGVDLGYPGEPVRCTPDRVLSLLEKLPRHSEPRLILAHAGASDMFDETEKKLCGSNVYFDLAFSIDRAHQDQLMSIIKSHGSEKILFATDCPWASQKKYVEMINTFPLSDAERENILYKNAEKILFRS